LAWNVLNVASGVGAQIVGLRSAQDKQAAPTQTVRAVGGQAIAWGALNILIALGGQILTTRRAAQPGAGLPQTQQRELRNLRRLLWINSGLDVIYMLGGYALTRSAARAPKPDIRRGTGLGIILQGGCLLIFDVIQAIVIPPVQDER
jgi:hypothetical protein